MKASLALGLAALAATANAGTHVGIGLSFHSPPPVIVHRAPPPRIVERIVAAPGPGYVWVPGHYTWTGSQWAWVAGAWLLPPRPEASWVDGAWNPQTQQWVEAHWEIPAAPAVVTAPPPGPPPVAVPTPAPAVVPVQPADIRNTPEVVVVEPPPEPIVEVRPANPPGPDYVWISGYWGWENGKRQWYRGHWERPPHGFRVWVAPRWEHRANGYAFFRGHWM